MPAIRLSVVRRAFFVAAIGAVLGMYAFHARAAEDGPQCTTLVKAQKAAGKDTAIVAVNPAQFHFLQGLYVSLPSTPPGLPPGDGALLLTHDKSDSALILWTRGILACSPMPILHATGLMKMLAEVKAGVTDNGDRM